jgi:hypothetical protein
MENKTWEIEKLKIGREKGAEGKEERRKRAEKEDNN